MSICVHKIRVLLISGRICFNIICLERQSTRRISHPLCCSVVEPCLPLCTYMACSMPGFPVLQYLPELARTHVHQVGDAMQPSHPLSPSSPPALSLSQYQGLFQWVSSSHQVTKVFEASASVLPMNIQSWFLLGLTGFISLQSKGLLRVHVDAMWEVYDWSSMKILDNRGLGELSWLAVLYASCQTLVPGK